MKNAPATSLRIPEPPARPGDTPVYSYRGLSAAGEMRRPAEDTPADDMRDLAYGLVRVLDDRGFASGPWDPKAPPETLLWALRQMMLTRSFDARMFRAQRQGKTTFYLKSTGEEAVSVGAALALHRDDMCFPTYRQQSLLIARGCPLEDMVNQVFSNRADRLKGHQLPVMYSSREHGFFAISGGLGTQFIQAVGWAMATAYRGEDNLAAAWIGEGATASADFHHALTFAAVYRPPVLLNVVNNQWAISSFQGIAGGLDATFAARAVGYGLPSLRVDGNDLLAVYAATQWAAARARANLGATVIELYTYRAEGHSTSDDPTRYRPADEPEGWPLGDPVERLKQHLLRLGVWSDTEHSELVKALDLETRAAIRAAEANGTLSGGSRPGLREMFEDVYKEMPWHLRKQRQELGV